MVSISFVLSTRWLMELHAFTATAIQVESEDSDESESEEEMPQNVRLTKRQAALAKARKGIASSETSVGKPRHLSARLRKIGPSFIYQRIS